MLPQFEFVRPHTLSQAGKILLSRGAVIHAGGTDLLGCLRDGVFTAEKVVSISSFQELRGISPTPDGGVKIGALTTLAEIAVHPLIREKYAALALGVASAASPQIRNQGTLGGNLCQRPRCWYFRGDFHCLRKGGDQCYAADGRNQYHCIFGGGGCYIVHPSDTASPLVALGASASVVGPESTRIVPLDSFFVLPSQDHTRENVLRPGEILIEITLPPPRAGRTTYRKVRERSAWDFALAGVALVLNTEAGRIDFARIVLSGVAPIPWRATEAEKTLLGKPLNSKTIDDAAAASVRGASPLAENEYKVHLVQGIVREGLADMM